MTNDTTRIEELLHTALLLHAALKKAREEMPPCHVAMQINFAEHRMDDAVDCLRSARKWVEDEYMNGSKSVEQLLIEAGITLGRCQESLGTTA